MTLPSRPIVYRIILISILAIIGISVIATIINTGKIHISAQNGGKGTYAYSLTNSASGVITAVRSQQSTLTKSVDVGSYTVAVTQDNESFFSTAKVSGLFHTSTVDSQLKIEKYREFVGDNPGGCMYYINKTLISANCSDGFNVMKIHVAASDTSPGYTLDNPNANATYGYPQGIVSLGSGTFMLIQPPQLTEQPAGINVPTGYTIYPVAADLSLGTPITLSQLDVNKSYSMMPYKSGFIIYSSDYSHLYYYRSLSDSPNQFKIALTDAAKTGITPSNLLAQNSTGILALTYGGASSRAATTTVAVYDSGQTTYYVLPDKGAVARPCGTKKLCVITEGNLKVYDVNGKTAKFAYSIPNVSATEDLPNGLLIITKTGIASFDADNGSGYYQYSLGAYKLCSFQPAPGGFLVCVTNQEGKKAALYVDQSKPDTNSIDKKVNSLSSISQINTLSINGRYIYIVPRGPLVYNSALHEYGIDPSIQKSINDAINKKFKTVGINPNDYIIKLLSP